MEDAMDLGSFLAGIVSGGAAAALLVWLWMRGRVAVAETRAAIAGQATETFQAAADAALRSSQGAFLEAARATLDTLQARMAGDLAARQAQLEGVVRPLAESVAKLGGEVREIEASRREMAGGLREQLTALARETAELGNALKSPAARGRWGELTLRRVAELAGMSEWCDFAEQETQDSRLRPDLTVRLPGNRAIAIDAKVPLHAYLDSVAARDEAARLAARQRHAQQVLRHVDALAAKQYWAQFPQAPELVVLFLPGDHFFAAALEVQPDLIDRALEKKVLIATPLTLIAVLKGIAYGWRQAQLAENAERIRAAALEFFDRLTLYARHYAETGRALERTVEAYNRSVGSWESRLAPALRRVRDLGVDKVEAESLEPVDLTTRAPRAAQSDLFS
jgi:DNA recombination protein RmuC